MRTTAKEACAALVAGAVLSLAACAADPQLVQAPREPAAGPAGLELSPPQLSSIEPAAGAAPGLIGLTRADVSRLLGRPTLLRREPPAEVWQYAGAACVLHVFIYQEQDGGRVAHYEAAKRSGRRLAARDCYARLLAGRRWGES